MNALKTVERRILVEEGIEVGSVWSRPSVGAPQRVVILAHGAGNDMHAPFLRHMHEGLAARGAVSIRFNFPYKEQGRKAPDRAPRLEATWRAVIAAVRAEAQLAGLPLVLGGKSMGGRMASHLAAAGEPCAGLLLLGYPLHPARRPETLRSAHLARIRCPTLFVQGSRDPLCDLALLERELGPAPAPWRIHVIDGGDHSFKVPKRWGRSEAQVWGEILEVAASWIEALP
ncbi:MAG TPA: hypothetical protein ENO23_10810 [Alphaproteobacteria bacterium]|nr:hypothetical protein [Alphaproteobacteria bacterium]